MPASTEKTICLYMARAIQRMLPDVNTSQVTISVAKFRDANWQGMPMYQIIPGARTPDGGGWGAQAGGDFLIRQQFTVNLYIRLNLDQYSYSQQMLTNDASGLLDLFNALRQLFALTWFGDVGTSPETSTMTLTEPFRVVRESPTVIEDPNLGIASREFVWECQYSEPLPPATTINLADVIN